MIENHDFYARLEHDTVTRTEKFKQYIFFAFQIVGFIVNRKKDDSVDLFDENTGKPFFKPKVGRGPMNKAFLDSFLFLSHIKSETKTTSQ